MQNLAGNQNATEIVTRELTRCGITPIQREDKPGEVPSQIVGKLGTYTFRRAWYYYVVEGNIPVEIAWELYRDPVGITDIRVDGHCGCPEPVFPWIQYVDKDGYRLIPAKDISDCKKILAESPSDFYKNYLDKVRCIDDVPECERIGSVSCYHIDSELGLYIFVQTLKRENLI